MLLVTRLARNVAVISNLMESGADFVAANKSEAKCESQCHEDAKYQVRPRVSPAARPNDVRHPEPERYAGDSRARRRQPRTPSVDDASRTATYRNEPRVRTIPPYVGSP